MNYDLFSDCPFGGQSTLCWNLLKDGWIESIDLVDPSACGTSLKKGGKSDRPSAFLTNTDSGSLPKLNPSPDLNQPLRRPLRVLLIDERQDIFATIQNLHKRGFADAGEWSIPLPFPQQNAVAQFIPRGAHIVISVHTKYLS